MLNNTKKVIHAANIAGIDDLYNNNDNYNYLCCSSMDCQGFMARHILFLVEGEVLAEHWGDTGSDGKNHTGLSPKNTEWDEIHIANGFCVHGLYYHPAYSVEAYAIAYAYITDVLQLPCEIYNAGNETVQKIRSWSDEMDDETFYDWLYDWNIEILSV